MLTVTRTTETLAATWDEIYMDAEHWRIPADRMKAGKPHRIPLTPEALAILNEQLIIRNSKWVFAGQKMGKNLSNMAMSSVLKRLKWLEGATVRGLRSTFRDWVSEQTNFDDRLAEIALAHQLSDRVRAACSRSDQFEKRRLLMARGVAFVTGANAKVIQLRSAPE